MRIAFLNSEQKNYNIVNLILFGRGHYTNRQKVPGMTDQRWVEVDNHNVREVPLHKIAEFPERVIRHLLLKEMA